ncbi:DUF6808 domain-containing protein [Capnocytophaga canis]|uniref:DUF6808 domain-containing protein n=1 Tax=Capnocytophaga canis TaxID=1848903 RepID=UPI0037CF90BF
MRIRILLFTLIIALCVSLLWNVRQSRERKANETKITELIALNGKAQVVTQYVRDSITHTVYRDVMVRDKTTEKQLAITKSYADSLEHALQVSIDKITSVTKTNARLISTVKMLQSEADKPPNKHYSDRYLSLTYNPLTDSLWLKYDISLNIAKYSKRKWFLGEKQYFVDVFADDPRVTIQGLKTFTVAHESPRRWAVALQGGYGLHFTQPPLFAPYVGVGLSYNLIQF